ncbi:L-galactonate dehydratase [Saitozyma sp. JCM 24511]|nr:L-galactonate dehydratase [Saitozyma sp. JCM 24511]
MLATAPDFGAVVISSFSVRDVRWPTSLDRIGTDAMNVAGEDSHGRVYLHTNTEHIGVGWSFANGLGTDLGSITSNFASFHRSFLGGQIRFMSPERGVMQLAACACLNAIWDLWCKVLGKPLWKLVTDMSPEEFVGVIDFRYITDMITPAEAMQLLRAAEPGMQARKETAVANRAVVGYSTSVGGLGTPDEEVEGLLRSAMAEGFNRFKLRLGLGVERDRKRLEIIRSIAGPDAEIYVDANEQWDVPTALAYLPQLADYKPRFIEEPTSPDDILGHKRVRDALKQYGIGVATGEHVNNRVMFKQFISEGAIDFLQLDAVRLSGINEILAVLLMAAKHDIPVVPHAGGVGMVEICSHIATIAYVKVWAKPSMMEYTRHLHGQSV